MDNEKITKEQKKRPGIYQSSGTPEHFENEGGDNITTKPNEKEEDGNTKDDADFDKMVGNAKE